MLTTKNGNVYAFVGSNANRDEFERQHVPMYDLDDYEGTAETVFDGEKWLVPRISVEPGEE